MKKIKQLAFALIAISFVTACDKAENLVDIPIPFSFDKEFSVVDQNGAFSKAISFTSRDNAGINKNFNKIKSYEVTSISVVLSNIRIESGKSTKLSKLAMKISGTGVDIDITVSQDIDLAAASGGSLTINLDTSQKLLDAIRDKIESGNTVTISTSAEIVDGSASFDGVIKIAGKVVVAP